MERRRLSGLINIFKATSTTKFHLMRLWCCGGPVLMIISRFSKLKKSDTSRCCINITLATKGADNMALCWPVPTPNGTICQAGVIHCVCLYYLMYTQTTTSILLCRVHCLISWYLLFRYLWLNNAKDVVNCCITAQWLAAGGVFSLSAPVSWVLTTSIWAYSCKGQQEHWMWNLDPSHWLFEPGEGLTARERGEGRRLLFS